MRSDSGLSPIGIDVDKPWGQYFLSFRTDISSKGMVLYASNDPDPQGSYSDSREHFMTKKEPFLLDCKPDNNITTDVALLIGSTYSDYESDVHFTPVSVGGTIDLDDKVVEIAELEKKVSSLTMSEDTLRQSITSARQAY